VTNRTLPLRALALLAPLLALSPRPAPAQTRIAVLEEPSGTAVGLAVVLNAGSAWEIRQEAGLTYLAARSVVEEVRPVLDALGARATVDCDAAGIRFTLLLPPVGWEGAAEAFLGALFERPFSDVAVERARRVVLREAVRRDGDFPTEISGGLARALYGEGSRWTRPACGSSETLASLGAEEARRMARVRFTALRATAALAGPVDRTAARALLRRYLTDSDLPVLVPAPTPDPLERPFRLERNTVTTWIGLAFPFPAGTDAEALRLLAFRIEREGAPAAGHPELYDATARVEQHGEGGTLVVYLVTAPEQAREWIDRVRALVRTTAARPLTDPAFDALRRRYVGRRLLSLSAPEARALDAALELFFVQRFEPPTERLSRLTPEALQRAAAALGRPAVAVLGPR
jgi:predicted Zn-dependent peptidase